MQVRGGLFVVWRGQEFHANAEDEHHFTLHRPASGLPPADRDTLPKTVRRSEVEAAYLVTWMARYKGYVFQVDAFRDGKLVLSTCLMPPDEIGFEEVDRSVWVKRVPLDQVEQVWEEKRPFHWH